MLAPESLHRLQSSRHIKRGAEVCYKIGCSPNLTKTFRQLKAIFWMLTPVSTWFVQLTYKHIPLTAGDTGMDIRSSNELGDTYQERVWGVRLDGEREYQWENLQPLNRRKLCSNFANPQTSRTNTPNLYYGIAQSHNAIISKHRICIKNTVKKCKNTVRTRW